MNPRIAYQTIWDRCQHTAEVYDALKYLQALAEIPSEKQWIPCSERLPNDDDYKPYLNYTDAVWFCTSDGAIGIGWHYESTNEWEAFGDIVLRGKVVAWMPLPEPYRKEGDEE